MLRCQHRQTLFGIDISVYKILEFVLVQLVYHILDVIAAMSLEYAKAHSGQRKQACRGEIVLEKNRDLAGLWACPTSSHQSLITVLCAQQVIDQEKLRQRQRMAMTCL